MGQNAPSMDTPVDESRCDDEATCVYDRLAIERLFGYRLDLASLILTFRI